MLYLPLALVNQCETCDDHVVVLPTEPSLCGNLLEGITDTTASGQLRLNFTGWVPEPDVTRHGGPTQAGALQRFQSPAVSMVEKVCR
jgi:hypothetical protein